MKEFSFEKERKKYQLFTTPQKLRELVKDLVGDCHDKTVFDPCLGSGQMLCEIKAKKIFGTDVHQESCEIAKKNGFDCINADFLTLDTKKIEDYDLVISNPPFSLDGTPEQLEALRNEFGYMSAEFTKFYKKELLQWFVIKSFLKAKEKGFFILFPGICYRVTCLEFRRWLIEHNFLEKIIWLDNPGFDSTSISVVIFVLSKKKQDKKILLQSFDNYKLITEKETTTDEIKEDNYGFHAPCISSEQPLSEREKRVMLMGKMCENIAEQCEDFINKTSVSFEILQFLRGTFETVTERKIINQMLESYSMKALQDVVVLCQAKITEQEAEQKAVQNQQTIEENEAGQRFVQNFVVDFLTAQFCEKPRASKS